MEVIWKLLITMRDVAETKVIPHILLFLLALSPFLSVRPAVLQFLPPDMYVQLVGDYICWNLRCLVRIVL